MNKIRRVANKGLGGFLVISALSIGLVLAMHLLSAVGRGLWGIVGWLAGLR